MWSNAFCRTLEIALPDPSGTIVRPFGFGICAIVAHVSGDWTLRLCGGEICDVQLRGGWIAGGGRAVGLRWISSDRRRFACGLISRDLEADDWRRLLVRLRVPMATQLS